MPSFALITLNFAHFQNKSIIRERLAGKLKLFYLFLLFTYFMIPTDRRRAILPVVLSGFEVARVLPPGDLIP